MRKFVSRDRSCSAAGRSPSLLAAADGGTDRRCSTRRNPATTPRPCAWLSAKGANVNATGADGTTAIMYAAANDDLELVRALIKAGANVKLKNQFGTSALTEAAIIGSAPIIDALLKAGADPNFKNSRWRNSADGRRAQRQGRRGQGASGRGSRHQRQGNLGRTIRDHVGRRAKPGRHGEVPRVEGREPERSRQGQSVGAQDHPGASPEGHEQGRLHPAALCRA